MNQFLYVTIIQQQHILGKNFCELIEIKMF